MSLRVNVLLIKADNVSDGSPFVTFSNAEQNTKLIEKVLTRWKLLNEFIETNLLAGFQP